MKKILIILVLLFSSSVVAVVPEPQMCFAEFQAHFDMIMTYEQMVNTNYGRKSKY